MHVGEIVSIFSIGPRRGMLRATSAVDWYERGLALEATDPDGAMIAYRRALAGRPDLADAYNNLGRLHHDRGELGDAESLYRLAICAMSPARACERDPDRRPQREPMIAAGRLQPAGGQALYWFNLGVVVEDRGRHAEAIAAYERALELDGTLADAHFNLARQLERAAGSNELVLRRAVRHLARYRDLSRHQPIFK